MCSSQARDEGQGMRLIDKVEIAYFRSVYKDNLEGCAETNIIFGRNDAGKSNVLRALNLFFNNETSVGIPFKFDRDLNHARRAEVENNGTGTMRKFSYVKVWFNTPASWQASLGRRFWVKKQWSVTTQNAPHTEWEGAAQAQFMTRFLNKVKFHYVPAIKDRRIFEHLQAQIYGAVSEHEQFRGSLDAFAGALRERTLELTEGLQSTLGITSAVSPPSDLTDLFKSLEFETTSEAGDSYSLTLQRGDGVQVRHIPQILAFLSDRAPNDFHIWGFEEPENSLELATAIDEAERLRSFGVQRNKQLFLTSHSPAFFSLEGDDVSRYFVSRAKNAGERPVSTFTKIADGQLPGELMGETPHLAVISHHLVEASKLLEREKHGRQAVDEQLAEANQSLLFVEGESDKAILTKAWSVLIGTDLPFTIVSGQGTTKMKGLAAEGGVLRQLAPNRRVYVLVDNDKEGRDLLANRRLDGGARWVQLHNGVAWCRLPFNPELDREMRRRGIDKSAWPGTIENVFPVALRQLAVAEGVLRLSSVPFAELCDPQWLPLIVDLIPEQDISNRQLVLAPEGESKEPFARWLVERMVADPGICEPLRATLEGLSQLVAQRP